MRATRQFILRIGRQIMTEEFEKERFNEIYGYL
jgi:hypothetical protein